MLQRVHCVGIACMFPTSVTEPIYANRTGTAQCLPGSGSAFPKRIWIQPTIIMRADPDPHDRVQVNFVNHAYPLESLITFSVGNRSSPRCSGMTGMTTFSRLSSSSPPSIIRGSRNGFCRISNGWITGDV